jgi:hypothetical protein
MLRVHWKVIILGLTKSEPKFARVLPTIPVSSRSRFFQYHYPCLIIRLGIVSPELDRLYPGFLRLDISDSRRHHLRTESAAGIPLLFDFNERTVLYIILMAISGNIISGNGITLLSQATGYGMVIGFSVLFAVLILAAVRIQKLYLSEDSGKSEMFMVANRSVGTGLTASAVFSSWVWINETVFSCVVCYTYGIAARKSQVLRRGTCSRKPSLSTANTWLV